MNEENRTKKPPLVFLSNCIVEQKNSGEPHENAISKVTIEFKMIADDTHLQKHQDFLVDLREFLEHRNKGMLQS